MWLLMNARKNHEAKGESYTIDGFVHDITERKLAEEAIKQAEKRYHRAYNFLQGILESPQDIVIFALDREYRYLAFNKNHQRTMEQIWGVKIEIDTSMLSYIKDPADREKAKVNFDKALAGESFTLVEEYGDSLLNRRWYSNSYSTLKDGEGNVIGLTLILRDITKRKQIEIELLNAKQEAEAANKAKSQFLATMSHELRTPLNSVIGFSDILMSKSFGELTEKQFRYAKNINQSGKHLLELINEILDLSKIEAGKMDLHFEYFDVPDVINEVMILIAPLALKKNIDLKVQVEPHIGNITADKIKFKQILYNLATNAIKFTSEKGYVGINANLIDNMLQVRVIDNGIGIATEDLPKLFKSFQQLDSDLKREHDGTGLGLILVKKYVEMHGGNVWVESEVGKGSTFTFTIPVNDDRK